MNDFMIQYSDDLDIKGSITRMIVMRKCELGKAINKRSEKTHQKKIVKIHMNHGDKQVNKCEK